jgi:3-isopropylmalate/(R)-2-methylmalate dehydratase small subunit
VTPFTTLTGVAAPLLVDNVDTDTIIPSREMKTTGRTGLADGLFAPWRYRQGREPEPGFVLNRPEYAAAPILAAGANFGCGSSREHAVWALAEWGIRAVIAESFAPIFRANALRNGLLPVELPRAAVEALAGREVTIDLREQSVACEGAAWTFEIEPEAREMMLEGLDAIELTLKAMPEIDAWTAADRALRPWVYVSPLQPKAGEGDRPQDGGGVKAHLPPRTNSAIERARKLRREMSMPESMLWRELRKRPGGLKFRRQHPAGRYVLDFYCPAARLCIEVDGEAHNRGMGPAHDATRDRFLGDAGVTTLRIAAADVIANLEGSVRLIESTARKRLPLHRPADGPPPHAAHGEEI